MKHLTLAGILLIAISIGCNQSNKTNIAQQAPPDRPEATKPESNILNPQSAENATRLQMYFERYCDYVGGLGIGFVASHTYDYKFRQHLKTTDDQELKRLFVLQRLYLEVDLAMHDYEAGQIRIGKSEYRQMTADEKIDAKNLLLEKLQDLERFDPGDPEHEIAAHRANLK